MADIWFIRHGESLANSGAPTENPSNIPLTSKGHEQAADVAALFSKAPDLVVMSPYIRTQLTAAPTLDRFENAQTAIWPIEEFCYLSPDNHRNTTAEQRQPFSLAYWAKRDPDHIDGRGAESFADLVARIHDMRAMLAASPHSFIAVFGHGLFFHTMEVMLKEPQLSLPEVMDRINHIRQHAHMPNVHIIKAYTDNGQLFLSPPDRKAPACRSVPRP